MRLFDDGIDQCFVMLGPRRRERIDVTSVDVGLVCQCQLVEMRSEISGSCRGAVKGTLHVLRRTVDRAVVRLPARERHDRVFGGRCRCSCRRRSTLNRIPDDPPYYYCCSCSPRATGTPPLPPRPPPCLRCRPRCRQHYHRLPRLPPCHRLCHGRPPAYPPRCPALPPAAPRPPPRFRRRRPPAVPPALPPAAPARPPWFHRRFRPPAPGLPPPLPPELPPPYRRYYHPACTGRRHGSPEVPAATAAGREQPVSQNDWAGASKSARTAAYTYVKSAWLMLIAARRRNAG